MAADDTPRDMTYEEAVENRRDPHYGDPVCDLGIHAYHWIDCAIALYPERIAEFHRLQDRIDPFLGHGGEPTSHPDWPSIPTTDGEIVLALETIVDVMRQLAPFVTEPRGRH